MQSNQRNILIAILVVIVVAAGGYWYWSGQRAADTMTAATPAAGKDWPRAAELLQPGPLGEMAMGDPAAPVTMIEYASVTCVHCANFHTSVLPELKEKYIDTGKVYFIFREFPFDPLALGAFALARCAGDDKYFPFVDLLFAQHGNWTRSDQPVNALFNLSKQAGFTEESFDKCVTNQDIRQGIEAVRDRGAEEFDVNSTPTFFINGKMVTGVQPVEELDKLFAPYL